MTEVDILAKLKEEIRAELGRFANEELDKLVEKFTHKFECEMGKHKADLISAMMKECEILVRQNQYNQQPIFQINITGGVNNDRQRD